jgi:hypothetical protein
MLCIKMKTCKEWRSSNVKESETRANKIIKQILEVEQTKNTEYFDFKAMDSSGQATMFLKF